MRSMRSLSNSKERFKRFDHFIFTGACGNFSRGKLRTSAVAGLRAKVICTCTFQVPRGSHRINIAPRPSVRYAYHGQLRTSLSDGDSALREDAIATVERIRDWTSRAGCRSRLLRLHRLGSRRSLCQWPRLSPRQIKRQSVQLLPPLHNRSRQLRDFPQSSAVPAIPATRGASTALLSATGSPSMALILRWSSAAPAVATPL